MKKHIRIESYYGRVVGFDVDVVKETEDKIIIKSWNGYKILVPIGDHWEVNSEHKVLPEGT